MDVTERFEYHNGQSVNTYAENPLGSMVVRVSSATYSHVVVPKQKGIEVDIGVWGPTSNWPNGIIFYVDENDIVVGFDGVTTTENPTLSAERYNRLALNFPKNSVKAYVNSADKASSSGKLWPPKVYKKVF